MDNAAQFSSIARKLLPLVEAALALSKDEELLNMLRLYGRDPTLDLDSQTPRPSLAGPSTRKHVRRRRNPNPCTRCVASRQACRYVNDDPLRCTNCIDNDYDCVIHERKRPRPVLAIDMSAITAPRMNRRVSSNISHSLSSGIPGSATSAPEPSMNVLPPAPGLDPHNVYSPSYTLGVQSSNSLLLPNFENHHFLPQSLPGSNPLDVNLSAPQMTSTNRLRMFFPNDLRNSELGLGPPQPRGFQEFEYPFPPHQS